MYMKGPKDSRIMLTIHQSNQVFFYAQYGHQSHRKMIESSVVHCSLLVHLMRNGNKTTRHNSRGLNPFDGDHAEFFNKSLALFVFFNMLFLVLVEARTTGFDFCSTLFLSTVRLATNKATVMAIVFQRVNEGFICEGVSPVVRFETIFRLPVRFKSPPLLSHRSHIVAFVYDDAFCSFLSPLFWLFSLPSSFPLSQAFFPKMDSKADSAAFAIRPEIPCPLSFASSSNSRKSSSCRCVNFWGISIFKCTTWSPFEAPCNFWIPFPLSINLVSG
mmetsp:Transcript_16870/g.34729  ORF Transcript_16870/g.34729 Transcript_16870/m.34729 type:complete len:273 (+) Transcript_16870:60-878(+)